MNILSLLGYSWISNPKEERVTYANNSDLVNVYSVNDRRSSGM